MCNEKRIAPTPRGVVLAAVLALGIPTPGDGQQEVGVVEGRVLDGQGATVSRAEVRIVSLGRVVVSGDDGRFRVPNVPPGSHVLDVSSERAGRAVERVEVGAGETVTVEVRLEPVFHIDELVVSAGPDARQRGELAQATSALGGRELRSRIQPTLGETLAGEPGVSSSYFGPGSSRPVIRGLGGDRVRILEGGIGTGDASTTSPDHAVSVEPQAAERIEVIRGPATLLYGGSAIGGVVNVIDRRIPTELPAAPIRGELVSTGSTVSDERDVSGSLDGAIGRLAWHTDAAYRKAEDYNIPGFARVDGAEDPEARKGVLLNSGLRTWSTRTGVSYVASNGYVGGSFTSFDNDYGVPPSFEEPGEGEEEGEGEGGIRIDQQSRRGDLQGEWRFPNALVERVKARFGYTDYRHFELEPSGEIGTRFDNESWEARVEAQRGTGVLGVQFGNRDFSAIGEEAFVPPTETFQFAVFGLQRYSAGPVGLELGARFETSDVDNIADRSDRTFTGVSVSGGANWAIREDLSLALSVARSVKLPSAEELFSDGPHLATNSFEVGDPTLDEEEALSFDVTLRGERGPFSAEVTGFVNDFSDFIFEAFTPDVEDGLPVRVFSQDDALFAGVEGKGQLELLEFAGQHLGLEAWGDWVKGTLSDTDEPLPRITPARAGGGIRLDGAPWTGSVRVTRTLAQDRIAAFETSTDGYTMLDAHVGYRFFFRGQVHELSVTGRNLADETARNHVSFLKDFVPLPGREFRFMYRVGF